MKSVCVCVSVSVSVSVSVRVRVRVSVNVSVSVSECKCEGECDYVTAHGIAFFPLVDAAGAEEAMERAQGSLDRGSAPRPGVSVMGTGQGGARGRWRVGRRGCGAEAKQAGSSPPVGVCVLSCPCVVCGALASAARGSPLRWWPMWPSTRVFNPTMRRAPRICKNAKSQR